jgi:hypothetical protein
MVFGPTLLLFKNKKKKQLERKIKNKRKGEIFSAELETSPPLDLSQKMPKTTSAPMVPHKLKRN